MARVPKGWLPVTVGEREEEKRGFVIPVEYVNHPLFARLLKEAEEEYGFQHKGPISIPCHVEEFCHVRGLIRTQTSMSQHLNRHCKPHHFFCFNA